MSDDVLQSMIVVDSHVGKTRMTCFRNGWTVETWWDSDMRAYVTEIKDQKQRLRDWQDLRIHNDNRYATTVKWAGENHEAAIDLVVKES